MKKIKNTLIGIHRVIRENGKFYVSVPDLKLLCKIFIDPNLILAEVCKSKYKSI